MVFVGQCTECRTSGEASIKSFSIAVQLKLHNYAHTHTHTHPKTTQMIDYKRQQVKISREFPFRFLANWKSKFKRWQIYDSLDIFGHCSSVWEKKPLKRRKLIPCSSVWNAVAHFVFVFFIELVKIHGISIWFSTQKLDAWNRIESHKHIQSILNKFLTYLCSHWKTGECWRWCHRIVDWNANEWKFQVLVYECVCVSMSTREYWKQTEIEINIHFGRPCVQLNVLWLRHVCSNLSASRLVPAFTCVVVALN